MGVNEEVSDLQTVFTQNLRILRERRSLSQVELAERCRLSQSFIAEIERGKKFPSPKSIERICAALEVRPFELFLGPEDYAASIGETGLAENLYQMRDAIEAAVLSTIHRIVPPDNAGKDNAGKDNERKRYGRG